MAQGSNNKDPVVKAQRKLSKAQLKLHVAEEKHAQMREEGRQEIEKARLRAARWLAKSAKKVEQRTSDVMRAEERLIALTASSPAEPSAPEEQPARAPRVEGEVAKADEQVPVAAAGPETANGLVERDLRALEVLRRISPEEGATVREWRLAAGMSETTFARARKALLDRGYVTRDGEMGRDARYGLTDAGQVFTEANSALSP